MPRALSAKIESELIKSTLTVIDLIKIVLPAPIGTLYFSTRNYTYDSHPYVARVLSVGSWTRSMNPETDDLSIVLGNADGYITEIFNTVEMEYAQISLIRVFPDISPVEAIDPYWVGFGGTISIDEEKAEWQIHFGFRGFMQKGLRKFAQNCWKIFDDGVYCPYTAEGEYSTLSSGIDSDDVSMSVGDPTHYSIGDIVIIDTEEIKITAGDQANPFTISRGYNGTVQASHSSSANVKHVNCDKSKSACRRRSLFGPPDKMAGYRYFGGCSEQIPWIYRQWGSGAGSIARGFFFQGVVGNQSIQGKSIPAAYGYCGMKDVPAIAVYDADSFLHALFIVCEGEITSVAQNTVSMEGTEPDDCPASYNAGSTSNNIPHNESLMWWWGSTRNRESYANWYKQNYDSYLQNPYLFNDTTTGDGISLSDVFAVRVRTQLDSASGGDYKGSPNLNVQFVGRKVRTTQGWIDNNTALVTSHPNPIEVALDYCINGKFGARLDKSRIQLDASLQAESDYCDAELSSVITIGNVSGVVVSGPHSTGVVVSSLHNWALIRFSGITVADSALMGRTIKVTQAGKLQTKKVLSNISFSNYLSSIVLPFGMHIIPPTAMADDQYVVIDGTWDDGKIPDTNDTIQITGYTLSDTLARFKFNGALTEDQSVDKQLAFVLDNCNGYYINDLGKLVFKIKKAVVLSTIDALTPLKDYGTTRNILREDGVSSLRIESISGLESIANCMEVSYSDIENYFQETLIYVYDEELQLAAGTVLGDTTRVVTTKQLKLVGTCTKDQALRIGALRIREEAAKKLRITFKMSLKDSQQLLPGDIRKLDSYAVSGHDDRKLSSQCTYIRIEKIAETDKFTAEIQAYPHVNGNFDDSATNVVDNLRVPESENPLNYPQDVVPETPVESVLVSDDGTILSSVLLEVTYPE
jgi:hypothetical protein